MCRNRLTAHGVCLLRICTTYSDAAPKMGLSPENNRRRSPKVTTRLAALFEILLMIVFGPPECGGGHDFRHDGPAVFPALLQLLFSPS